MGKASPLPSGWGKWTRRSQISVIGAKIKHGELLIQGREREVRAAPGLGQRDTQYT